MTEKEAALRYAELYNLLYWGNDGPQGVIGKKYGGPKRKDATIIEPASADYYMPLLDKAYKMKDAALFDRIEEELHDSKKERHLNFYKERILEVLGCKIEEIEPILQEIRSAEVADIVLAAIESLDYLPGLPKEKGTHSLGFYKKALRRNRRILEKELEASGVGGKRRQKISKILESI